MVYYHYQDIEHWKMDFEEETAMWIDSIVGRYKQSIEELNFIFSTNEFLLYLNQKYLKHNYYTDVLTFDYSVPETQRIVGDIFISIEMVKENALELEVAFIDELHRVMIHGVFHLLGFKDKNKKEKEVMRRLEDTALNTRMF